MKKVYLLKVNQNGHIRYLGRSDARTLVRMARKTELNAVQEAQRPIEPKRLEELSKFVQDDGTLSTSIVIGTINDSIKIYPVDDPKYKGILYYTEFPETEDDFNAMQDAFDIMDGQHRLFSFLPDYCKLPDDVDYELSFEMYIQPTIKERRIIFKNTNEEQKPVSSNLLMYFRFQLDMLTAPEKEYYNLVSMLSEENSSPLKGRIIMSAEKITNGINANSIIALFDKIKLKTSIKTANLDDETLFKFIKVYLSGWERAVGSKLTDTNSKMGVFWKISGLRYMMCLIATFYDLAQTSEKNFTEEFVEQKIKEFCSNLAITPRELFDKNCAYYQERGIANPFGGESVTFALAEEHKQILNRMKDTNYDALAYMR